MDGSVLAPPAEQTSEEPSDIEGNECWEIVGPEFGSFRLPDGSLEYHDVLLVAMNLVNGQFGKTAC